MTETLEKLPDLAVLYRSHVAALLLQGFTDGIDGDRLTALADWALTGRPEPGRVVDLLGVFGASWHAAKEDGAWDGCPSAQAEADLAREDARAAQLAGHDDSPLGQALAIVTGERLRQVAAEGWTPEHDDQHGLGELALAAGAYAIEASGKTDSDVSVRALALKVWPWSFGWWKPSGPDRDLAKAGALILAEIERRIRASNRSGQ